tara:strand:+ start:182 stop:655 length:474 start_codon:yes stop_codon:yes gene_type:complete
MDNSFNFTKSSLDFVGMGELRGQAQKDSIKATRETATQFEAMFIQMMLKSMREATVKSDLLRSNTMDTFEQMFDRELSVSLAKRNTLGVADMLVKYLDKQKNSLQNKESGVNPIKLNKSDKSYPLVGDKKESFSINRPSKFNIQNNFKNFPLTPGDK